jgi:hypothetical protein
MAENLNLNVNVNTSGAEGSIGSLKKQLREAQNEVVVLSDKFGATSKEAIEAAKRVAGIKDQIGDAKTLVDAFNPDAKFKALSASLSGVAGGFAAVQGAMALFGSESENVQKTLLKVQSAMAISQGLQSIGESVDSFKQLGAVIQSTTLYQSAYNFIMGDTVEVTKEAVLSVEAETTALEAQAVATTEVAVASTGATTTLEAEAVATNQVTVATTGATIALRIFRAALIATGIGAAVLLVGLLVESFMNFVGAAEKARLAKIKFDKAFVEGSKKANTQYLEDLDALKEIDLERAGDDEDAKFQIEEDYRKKKIDALNEHYEKIKGLDVEAEAEIQKQLAKLSNDGTINRLQNEARLRKLANEIKLEEEVRAALKEKKAIDDELAAYEKRKKGQQKGVTVKDIESEAKKAKEEKEKEDADKQQELLIESNKNGLGKMLTDKAVAFTKGLELNKQNAEAESIIEKEKIQAKQDTAYAIADITAGLSSIIGQETAAGKAIAISSATIDTYLSASTIFKQAAKNPISIVNPAYPYLMAAPAVLAGIARVRQISSVSVPNGGGGGSMPSMSGQAPMMPQLPQAQVTQLNQQSINDIGNQAVRAYVIESDVTSNQQRIAAIRQRARFS